MAKSESRQVGRSSKKRNDNGNDGAAKGGALLPGGTLATGQPYEERAEAPTHENASRLRDERVKAENSGKG